MIIKYWYRHVQLIRLSKQRVSPAGNRIDFRSESLLSPPLSRGIAKWLNREALKQPNRGLEEISWGILLSRICFSGKVLWTSHRKKIKNIPYLCASRFLLMIHSSYLIRTYILIQNTFNWTSRFVPIYIYIYTSLNFHSQQLRNSEILEENSQNCSSLKGSAVVSSLLYVTRKRLKSLGRGDRKTRAPRDRWSQGVRQKTLCAN